MRLTSVEVDEELVAELAEFLGTSTPSETVEAGLREALAMRRRLDRFYAEHAPQVGRWRLPGDCEAQAPASMVESMATKKVTVTIPEDLLEEIREDTAERGISAYVTEAVRAKHERDQMQELVDWLGEEYGPLSAAERAAADKELEELHAEHARRRARRNKKEAA